VKIGVFDSGVGGLSVANAIAAAMPEHEVVLREDKEHVPYGNRTPEEIFGFVVPIFEALINEGCQIIVVACNTVSTTLIKPLREHLSVPLIAMEPMVKPAAEQTKTGVIAVCATPATLASERYAWLKQTFADGITVLEPDCSDWAYMIQHNEIDQEKIETRIQSLLTQHADIIVLGCTHYHWIEQEIQKMAAGKATVIQPESAIVARVRKVIDTQIKN
jgi:glutamate racemase